MEVNKVYLGDCREIMQEIPDRSVDLVFADLPFNIGINYKGDLVFDPFGGTCTTAGNI